MEIMGYVRPDGSIGVRNHLCVVSADDSADAVARRVAATIHGSVPLFCRGFQTTAGLGDDLLRAIILGTFVNPNVAAVIVITGNSDNQLAQLVSAGLAKTGKPSALIDLGRGGGVIGASAKATSAAITMGRDISTYRRERVSVSKLLIGIWLDKDSQADLNLALANCYERLESVDSTCISNQDLPDRSARTTAGSTVNQDLLNKIPRFAVNKLPLSPMMESLAWFKLLLAAAGAQVILVGQSRGHVPDHPLVPVIRITNDRNYYEMMADTIELDLSSCAPGLRGIADSGLLILSEVLATCSGRLSKCEIIKETAL